MRLFQIEPGPVIGRVLNHLLEKVLDDPDANNSETLTSLAREQIEQKETLSDNNNIKKRDK